MSKITQGTKSISWIVSLLEVQLVCPVGQDDATVLARKSVRFDEGGVADLELIKFQSSWCADTGRWKSRQTKRATAFVTTALVIAWYLRRK
jgi:hypothetical protein